MDHSNAPPRRTVRAPSSTSNPSSSNGTKSTHEKRVESVVELVSYVQLPFVSLAAIQEHQNPGEVSPFALDAYAIELHKPNIGETVAKLADEYPVLGALLDKLSIGGPIMGVLACAIAVGGQIAENHGAAPKLLKAAPIGIIDRQMLASALMDKNNATSDSDTTAENTTS